jgi:nitrogenase-stabilizing/protective protein
MTVLNDLSALSSAEDFFKYLEVPYEPSVINVARLHILRRMGEYLRGSDMEGNDDDTVRALCRDHLEKAYADFVASSPIEQRVFKVHKDAVAPKPEPAKPFVSLSALTGGE